MFLLLVKSQFLMKHEDLEKEAILDYFDSNNEKKETQTHHLKKEMPPDWNKNACYFLHILVAVGILGIVGPHNGLVWYNGSPTIFPP